jgi:hypothetical protein
MVDQRSEDLRIVEHARRWLPYGGCADSVLVDFGLTPDRYWQRLALLIEGPAGQQLPCDQRNGLRRQIRRATGVSASAQRAGVIPRTLAVRID